MRILLLGEFSYLHQNLKDGLLELGHHVVIASDGNSWRNIDRDIDLKYNRKLLPDVLSKRILPLLEIKKLTGFDVAQLMNPFLIRKRFFPNRAYIKYIMKNNSRFFMLGAGDDAFFWRQGRERLEYGPFDDFLKYDKKSDHYYLQEEKMYKFSHSH